MKPERYFGRPCRYPTADGSPLCAKLHCVEPGKTFVRPAHAILNRAFAGIRFSMEVYQLDPFRIRERVIHTPGHAYWRPLFKKRIISHPDAQYFVAVMDSDTGMCRFESAMKAFRYSVLYNKCHGQVKPPCQLWIGVRDGNELLTCIYASGKKCAEEELATVCLIQIQSHLETAWKNWKLFRAMDHELGLLKEAPLLSKEAKATAVQIREKLALLTDRQREVVEQLASGKDNQQIADELQISVLTVKKHLQAIFQTLGVRHRTALAAKWHQADLAQLE